MMSQKDDIELIEAWRQKNKRRAYDELKGRHSGMVHKFVNKYAQANVPKEALEAKAWGKFDDAVESYDDSKGAQFSTHLHYHLMKLDRYTKKHQNVGRIPEAKAGKIGDLNRAKDHLKEKHKEQPSHEQVADHLGMQTKDVKELEDLQRKDLYEGGFSDAADDDKGFEVTPEDLEAQTDWVLEQARGELRGQEQELYDHLIGYRDTEKITSTQRLAQKFNVSPGRISQMKRSIGETIKPHLRKRL